MKVSHLFEIFREDEAVVAVLLDQGVVLLPSSEGGQADRGRGVAGREDDEVPRHRDYVVVSVMYEVLLVALLQVVVGRSQVLPV